MDLGLKDKVAIVTGGSDGIGKATAASLAQEGCKVVICARRREFLENAAKEISQKTGGTVLPVPGDVEKPEDIQRVVQETVRVYGGVDILVNNAGRGAAGPFMDASDQDWMDDFNLKVWAAVRFCRAVIPYMRQRGGGRIINVTNTGGKAPGARSVPTSVARAAGIAVTKALSKEFAPDGILVNTVVVCATKSGQNDAMYPAAREKNPSLTLDEFYTQMAHQRGVPLGRVSEPEEVGDVIAFLASERASFVTGVALNVDGGASPVV